MPNEDRPDLSLFLDILRTLERIGAPVHDHRRLCGHNVRHHADHLRH